MSLVLNFLHYLLPEPLAGVRSSKIDAAVTKVFHSLDPKRHAGLDRVRDDDLALACMNRLIGKGMDEEFRRYCENRVRELEQRGREPAETQRLEALQEALQRMPPGRP